MARSARFLNLMTKTSVGVLCTYNNCGYLCCYVTQLILDPNSQKALLALQKNVNLRKRWQNLKAIYRFLPRAIIYYIQNVEAFQGPQDILT